MLAGRNSTTRLEGRNTTNKPASRTTTAKLAGGREVVTTGEEEINNIKHQVDKLQEVNILEEEEQETLEGGSVTSGKEEQVQS